MRKNKWCCRALACVFALGLGARLAKAQGCSNWITIDPVYDAATCQLRTVLAHHISYSSCGAPSPGSLWVRIYKDTPSTQGGNTYEDYLLGCFTNGCGSGAGSVNCGVATYKRFDFVLPSSYYQPGTTLYLEEWIGKTNGIQMSYCGLSGRSQRHSAAAARAALNRADSASVRPRTRPAWPVGSQRQGVRSWPTTT